MQQLITNLHFGCVGFASLRLSTSGQKKLIPAVSGGGAWRYGSNTIIAASRRGRMVHPQVQGAGGLAKRVRDGRMGGPRSARLIFSACSSCSPIGSGNSRGWSSSRELANHSRSLGLASSVLVTAEESRKGQREGRREPEKTHPFFF